MVRNAPPTRPSTVLLGLIQAATGVRPALDPTNSAPMSLATTPTTVASRTPLPQLLGKRRISAA